jgi:uncharacterized protein (TIGR04255 family)
MAAAIPSYARPPLSEVACGVQFAPIGLQTTHLGQFWTEIAQDYPSTQDAPPTPEVATTPGQRGQLGALGITVMIMPPLRRVLMLSKGRDFVVQVQDSRFHYNWRRLSPDSVYPRFPKVFDGFLNTWGMFSAFLKRARLSEPTPNRYELTYVNQLDALGSIRVEQSVKLFDWKQLKAEFLTEPQQTNIGWSFLLPDGKGIMNVSINRVIRPEGGSAVLFTLACSGPAGKATTYSLNDWFETAHEWIVRGFTDLTTPEAHKIWQREA